MAIFHSFAVSPTAGAGAAAVPWTRWSAATKKKRIPVWLIVWKGAHLFIAVFVQDLSDQCVCLLQWKQRYVSELQNYRSTDKLACDGCGQLNCMIRWLPHKKLDGHICWMMYFIIFRYVIAYFFMSLFSVQYFSLYIKVWKQVAWLQYWSISIACYCLIGTLLVNFVFVFQVFLIVLCRIYFIR